MTRYYFYSADLFVKENSVFDGGFHGVYTVDDARTPAKIFADITEMLQQKVDTLIRGMEKEYGLEDEHDATLLFFHIKQFHRIE